MTTSTTNDPLEWFELKNYEGLNKLTKAQWLDQLLVRKRVIDLLSDGIQHIPESIFDRLHFFQEYITTSPIIDFKAPSFIKNFGVFRTSASDNDKVWNWNSGVGIHQLTLEEAVRSIYGVHEVGFDEMIEFVDNNDEGHQPWEISNQTKDYFSYSLDSLKNAYKEHLTLMVDLSVPDELLVHQLKDQLKIYRKKLGIANPNIAASKDLDKEKFIIYGVLPYIDIMHIWGPFNNYGGSQQDVADKVVDVGRAATAADLRATTKPWAEAAISMLFLNKLSIEVQTEQIAAMK